MPFNRPTLETLVTRTSTDLETRLGANGKVLRRSVVAVFGRVIAAVAHVLYGFLDWAFQQLFPDTAEGEYLERWASIWNVFKKPATFAQFNVTFTGSNGSAIPIDTPLRRPDGVEFKTQASVSISSGSASVAVICLTAGVSGNTSPGSVLQLISPIVGVNAQATVGSVIENAEDQESDDSLRARLIARIQRPPHGGTSSDYIFWALEVPGVTRAWVYPGQLGPGTVGLAFVMDDKSPSIIPDSADVTAVQTYIDGARPVTADLTVYAPTAVPVNFTIELTPDTPEVRAAVIAELKDLLRRECEPGGTLLISRIREAISVAAGETDHALSSPSGNVTFGAGEIGVMGAVTWL